ncbi:hypothetical protein NLU04_10965 [Streptomyces cavourensis]|uniref:Bacterial transcriptional activator domain-containing protein n=1 Tax=Streptomyces cavourensis TaxID=67258 RepID=A0ABY5FHN6_9ACTN|nr:BTAD domain-containing putative transcriptional regulator [Streptomyces cavourensis]UTR83248.1 hypothetical protein NLU04_10965 [Streptomyces cavourensis]
MVLLGRHAEALDALMAAPLSHPHDEPLAGLRMRALYGSGRQAEALAHYQEMRRRLLEQLGMEPGEELRRVHQAVLRRDDEMLLGRRGRGSDRREPGGPDPEAAEPSPRAAEPPAAGRGEPPRGRRAPARNDLPGDAACLVGREEEFSLLTAPVSPEGVSVVAVDGTAGVGKTALVARAARALADAYPDGCL